MTHPDPDRETALHRALVALPWPRAPHTLLPRVMQAVLRPWYTRPWLNWPLTWRVASCAGLVAILAAAWTWLPAVEPVAEATRMAARFSTLADLLSRLLLQPVMAWILTLSAIASLTCGAFWAALTRLTLGGRSS